MKNGICVDVNTLSNMVSDGKLITAKQLLDIYDETGVLLYDSTQGEKPIVISGKVKLVDTQTDEGKAQLKELTK